MDLYSIIKKSFPLMEQQKIQSVVVDLSEKLTSQSLTIEDLKYAEPEDLYPHFELFQARKFLKIMNTQEENFPANVPCLATPHMLETPSSHIESSIIRWNRLPPKYIKKFEQRKRPLPSERHEIIRSFADDILEVHDKPGRKILSSIANEIVQKYPDSFQDKISKQVVGSGFYSLLVQLENRVANIKRNQKDLNNSNDVDDPSVMNMPSSSNEYGCVAWQPNEMPENQTLFSLETKKAKLINFYNSGPETCAKNNKEISALMRETYYLQRQDINGELSVEKVKMEWPLLFCSRYLNQHFSMLTNKNVVENFERFATESVPNLLKFFTSLGPKVKESLKIEKEIMQAATSVEQKKAQLIGVLYMLTAALDEDVNQLFSQVEEDSCDNEFSKLELPTTPCLVTKGVSAFYANKFFLIVDKVLLSQYDDIISALAAMFASYYILNVKYSKESASTMEFIQRVIMDINPLKGHKLQKKKGNRQWNFGTKLMKLIKCISDFNSLMA